MMRNVQRLLVIGLAAGWIVRTEYRCDATENSPIDRLVSQRLDEHGLSSKLCDDTVFVRRVYLDTIGTLPTAGEVWSFLSDEQADKRTRLIDELLRRDEFTDYWAMKWGDLLRIKAEFPINLWPGGAQAYHRWLRTSIAENKPYDQFARELLTSNGSNFRVGPVNFYRAVQNKTPAGVASAAALLFMGTRTDQWDRTRFENLTQFFSQIGFKPTGEWKEEVVFWDRYGVTARSGTTAPGQDVIGTDRVLTDNAELTEHSTAPVSTTLMSRPQQTVFTFPDGKTVSIRIDQDPRVVFADWLVDAENPWFARCVVNRVWAWCLGRGIIEPVDDLRDDNSPTNESLLAHLETDFVDSGYDLQRLIRSILVSKSYQSARVPLRRLEAEVLIDAINQITGTTDLYTSAVPEPFTYIPADMKAIALADGSITSSFLAMFGRSARATGMASERNEQSTTTQWLHMLNSTHIQSKIQNGPKIKAWIRSKDPLLQTTGKVYMSVLSRQPTPSERETITQYAKSVTNRQELICDVTWALINSPEFQYRH